MKKVILIALVCLPVVTLADHMEQWGVNYGYVAELAVPLQSNDLVSIFWVGRSANAEAFGKAWDAWRDAQADPTSAAAKLQARFNACGEFNEARRSYDVY
jgi:hypothetical protein